MFRTQISSDSVTLILPVTFHGEQGAGLIEEIIGHLRAGHRRFVLDLSHVGSLDSMGVGVLVQVARNIGDWGGALCLQGPSDEVSHILELTGLSGAFTVVKG